MASKKRKPPPAPLPEKHAAKSPLPGTPAMSATRQFGIVDLINRYGRFLIPAAIVGLVYLFLNNCLYARFTNWDDPGYIINDPVIKDISSQGIHHIFTTSVMGIYHPITILSYALEYAYAQLQPFTYHLDNLLLHLLATVLVYIFCNILSRRWLVATIAALLFGLHPMHVETVAWLSDRKDLLLAVFYFSALIAYVCYARAKAAKPLRYTMVCLLFILALLSKPIAVVFPLALLAIDLVEKRKWGWRLIIEKIPFAVIAIWFGARAISEQHNIGALSSLKTSFTWYERLALSGYALVTYLWKAIIPANLCNFYPYPLKDGGSLPSGYYLCIIAAVALLAGIVFIKRRHIQFGLLFFLLHILLLLQLIPVGSSIIADRYTYVPYVGLFYAIGNMASYFCEAHAGTLKSYMAMGALLCYALILGYGASERSKVWHDSISLWTDETSKQPLYPDGWSNLGTEYMLKFKEAASVSDKQLFFDSAYYCLNTAVALQPSYTDPYISLGILLRNVNKPDEAKYYYRKVVELEAGSGDTRAYLGLANILAMQHQFDSSCYYFRMALALNPNSAGVHSNLGNLFDMMGKPDSAIVQYSYAISLNPGFFDAYLNRGRLLQKQRRCDEALRDFDKALQLKPEAGEIYYLRSYCFAQNGNKPLALQNVEKAISLGFNRVDQDYYSSLKQ